MASEIQIGANLSVNKGGVGISLNGNATFNMAGKNMVGPLSQTIATSATALVLPNITGVPPILFLKNLDATNFVQVDASNTFNGFPQKVLAGGVILLAPQTATIYCKADTAAVQIMIGACEP